MWHIRTGKSSKYTSPATYRRKQRETDWLVENFKGVVTCLSFPIQSSEKLSNKNFHVQLEWHCFVNSFPVPTMQFPQSQPQIMSEMCHQSEPEGRKKGKNSSRNSSEGTGSNSRIITANTHVKPSLCAKHHSPYFPCVHVLLFTTAPCTRHYCNHPCSLGYHSEWVAV